MLVDILIPESVECLLKAGQNVDFDSTFYRDDKSIDITIDVSKQLKIPSDKIFNYLKKFVGDRVEKGDVLAQRHDFIQTNSIISQYSGTLKEINHNQGHLTISASTSQSQLVKAYFKGEVVEIDKNLLKLKLTNAKSFPIKSVSDNFGGATFYLKDQTKPINASTTANKIMVSESITSYIETKSEALGIIGFVTVKSPPQDTLLPKAQLKNIDDIKKIFQLNLPYCLLDKSTSNIYFYR